MKKLNLFCIIAAAVLLLAGVSGCGLLDMFKINDPKSLFDDGEEEMTELPQLPTAIERTPETPDSTQTPAPSATPEPTVDPRIEVEQSSDAEFMQNRANILMLGLDRSQERADWGVFRTDTMILVSVNFDTGKVDMISIPRDSYVEIYNKNADEEIKYDKINTAFGKGGGVNKNGYEYSMRTVSNLLGDVKINYYVGFDMNVVKEVVNAMGGVDYDVDVPVKMNGRTIDVGFQHMDGQMVLDYSRQRKGSSDVARVDRQQRILMAVFEQLKSTKQIFNIPKIYKAVEQNIDTNLSFAQICSLALQAANTDMEQLERHIIEGKFLNMNKLSYWGVSTYKLKKLVKEVFGKNMEQDMNIDADALTALMAQEQALAESEMAGQGADGAISDEAVPDESVSDENVPDESGMVWEQVEGDEDVPDESGEEVVDGDIILQ